MYRPHLPHSLIRPSSTKSTLFKFTITKLNQSIAMSKDAKDTKESKKGSHGHLHGLNLHALNLHVHLPKTLRSHSSERSSGEKSGPMSFLHRKSSHNGETEITKVRSRAESPSPSRKEKKKNDQVCVCT